MNAFLFGTVNAQFNYKIQNIKHIFAKEKYYEI